MNSSAVGNNNVSSIKVDAGYVAYLCDGTFDDPTACKMYPPGEHSQVASGTNDKADVIKVDQNDPARHGRWGDVVAVPQRAIAAANLPDGDIMFWNGGPIGNDIYRIDPKTMTLVSSGAPDDHDTFCPGPALVANGDLVLAGGASPTEGASSIFNWDSETWNRQIDMVEPHYYGTSVALADGRVYHALGTTKQANDLKSQSNFGEIWNGDTWQKLAGSNISSMHANNSYYNSNYYPYLHLMPTGNIFHTGGVPNMHEVDIINQQLIAHGIRAGNDAYRHWGNAIMIDEGMVLISGGRPDDPISVKTTVLVDFNQDTNVTSTYMAPMLYDRAFNNMVQLPTGDIFVSGGNAFGQSFQDYSAVLPGELWNRESNSWTEMAELTIPRNYHSSSLLLPDGRVWQGGGDCNHCDGGNHQSLQFYWPPYLFNADGTLAARPAINTFPTGENGIKASQSFNVKVAGSGAGNIADFNIIRLSSTTHQINTDVRRLSLDFTNQGNGNYQIEAHDNINVMTPGYWMLFAVNNNGVPSEAAIVHISTQPGTENPLPSERPTGPNNGGTSGDGVTVYADGNNSGASWSIGPGTYSLASIAGSPVGNDKISSIEIAPGYAVKACEHGSGGGECQTYTSSVNLVGTNFNDQISYLEVFQNNAVTVYADGNYNGVSWGIWPGIYDIQEILNSSVGNDAISSIEITPGYIVKACQHGGGGGVCQTYTSSVDLAGTNFDDKISYVEVIEFSADTILSTDILGDVNCDDGVSAVDALAILQYVVDIRTDTEICPLNNRSGTLNANMGDVNDDGDTNSVDALFILQCDVGLENTFCQR